MQALQVTGNTVTLLQSKDHTACPVLDHLQLGYHRLVVASIVERVAVVQREHDNGVGENLYLFSCEELSHLGDVA